MIKYFLIMTAVAILVAYFYNLLEKYLGDTWLTVGFFAVVLILLRVGLYLYRRSKGIKDNYLDE
ncbi:hypothetical protein NLO98_17875 [Pseudomonas syringae]|nr:hypothetical protein [Pseudomonas syringae]